MSLYTASIPQLRRNLTALSALLEKAEAHAETAGYPIENLLSARLAPDQYPLRRQVQTVTDMAKFAAVRLAGVDAPSHPDGDDDLPTLMARIASVAAVLDSVTPEHFEGAADKPITLRFLPEGKGMRGADYFNQFVVPNFYFHLTTAYAILRHNGVPVGKRDYLATMDFIDL